jgi:hypothetical protein
MLMWSAALLLFLAGHSVRAQTNLFFYDNLGRISVVLDTNGTDAAFYDYDAVGNIIAIRRQTVGAVNLFQFSPAGGAPNTLVTLQGTGFSPIVASNTVVFCGTRTAQVVSATANQIVVSAPIGSYNCKITVTTPYGVNSNNTLFGKVIGIKVTPGSTNLYGSASAQFSASVIGTNDTSVTWLLNGWIPAGTNTAWGNITTNGLYTAPANPPAASNIAIHARSVPVPDPLIDGIATITVSGPLGPIYSPTVSAQPGVPDVLGPIYSPTVSAGPSL